MSQRQRFGRLPNGRDVDSITLRNAGGVEIRTMTYGAVIASLSTPDRHGHASNIVVGFDRLERYVAEPRYYGAVVGRYANRIGHARFSLDGRVYHVGENEPPNHLHGGFIGFDKHVWDAEVSGNGSSVMFRRTSPDGEEGYPGSLEAQVIYTLTAGNELHVEYSAQTDAPTHVNLTQHSYFNLRGGGENPRDTVLGHCLSINANTYLPVTERLIPTGEIATVANTPFDFQDSTAIGSRYAGNYDHNFILNHSGSALTLAARVTEPFTGRTLEVRTTEPGLQLYSAGNHCGMCLETQHYPDSPNRPEFPTTVLRPGQRYQSRTEFSFGVA
jgi:aldose 1-epimerase